MPFLLPCRLKFHCVEMVGTIYKEVLTEDGSKYPMEDFGILNLEDLAVQPMDMYSLVLANIYIIIIIIANIFIEILAEKLCTLLRNQWF